MRKATLVLILLLSILNDAELKESILSQMEEEEPTLEVNQSLLRSEASRILRNLFKISFDFSKTVFEKEVVVHAGNPQITVKLSSSCSASISMGSNSGSIQVKGGAVINEKGTKVKLSKKEINFAGKFLNLNFNTMTATLTKKLKGATSDGTIKFSFSPTKNCCYVEFDTKDRARQAINLSGQLLCGQPCQIVPSQAEKNRQALIHRLQKEKDKEKNPGLMNNIVKYSASNEQIDLNDAPMKIYVGGLTENLANITEDDLCNIFGFGDIDSIELHKDPITGRSKGYAFIQFHRGSKAREVIQAMNGFVYQGKALKVGEANENNTVIKGKMYLAKQQQQQQLQQQQLQQQMQMMQQQQLDQQGQETKV